MYELSKHDKKKMDAAVKDAVEFFKDGVNLEQIKKYAQKLGYWTVFFDGYKDPILEKFDVQDEGLRDAFAMSSPEHKILFINSENDEETSVLSSLAQIGCITLGYLNSGVKAQRHNFGRMELEAHAFAFLVLRGSSEED